MNRVKSRIMKKTWEGHMIEVEPWRQKRGVKIMKPINQRRSSIETGGRRKTHYSLALFREHGGDELNSRG